jgi:hypothetical protein
VEVILALIIMVGILTVVLFFYQRIEETRRNVMAEAESVTLLRRLMDQISGELRMARAGDNPVLQFEGTTNALRFHTVTYVVPSVWLGSNAVSGDLRRVYYGLSAGTNETDVLGVERSEELPFTFASVTQSLGDETGLDPSAESEGEEALVDTPGTEMELEEAATGQSDLWVQDRATGMLLTDQVRFMHLRYFDGLTWRDTWDDTRLPRGVEISLGKEPMPEEADVDGYPYELYRRLIFLPGSEHPANRLPQATDEIAKESEEVLP